MADPLLQIKQEAEKSRAAVRQQGTKQQAKLRAQEEELQAKRREQDLRLRQQQSKIAQQRQKAIKSTEEQAKILRRQADLPSVSKARITQVKAAVKEARKDIAEQTAEPMKQIRTAQHELEKWYGESKATIDKARADLNKQIAEGLTKVNEWETEQTDKFKAENIYIKPKKYIIATEPGTIAPIQPSEPQGTTSTTIKDPRFKQPLYALETTGGWVSKRWYDSLSPKLRSELHRRGIENFNRWLADPMHTKDPQRYKLLAEKSSMITPDMMPTRADLGLAGTGQPSPVRSERTQQFLNEIAQAAISKIQTPTVYSMEKSEATAIKKQAEEAKQTLAEFKKTHEKHGGMWWAKSDWATLPESGKIAASKGIDWYNMWMDDAKTQIASANALLTRGEISGKDYYKRIENYMTPSSLQEVKSTLGNYLSPRALETLRKLDAYSEVDEDGLKRYYIEDYAKAERETGRTPNDIANDLLALKFDAATVIKIKNDLIPANLISNTEMSQLWKGITPSSIEARKKYAQEHPTDPRVITGIKSYDFAKAMKEADPSWTKFIILGDETGTRLATGIGKLQELVQPWDKQVIPAEDIAQNTTASGYTIMPAETPQDSPKIVDLTSGKVATLKGKIDELDMTKFLEERWEVKPSEHVKNFATGMGGFVADIAKTLGAAVPVTLLDAQVATTRGEYSRAATDVASLVGGFVVFPAMFPGMLAGAVKEGRPGKAVGMAAGLGLTFVVSPGKIIKMAKKTAHKLSPSITTDTALSINLTLNTMRPEWLIPEVRRQALNQVQELLTGRIPNKDALSVLRTGKDLVAQTQDGLISYRISAVERAGVNNVLYHVTGQDQGMGKGTFTEAFNKGGLKVEPAPNVFGGIYSTKQPAWNFLTRYKKSQPLIVATITSPRDYKSIGDIPKLKTVESLLQQDKPGEARRLLKSLDDSGQLPDYIFNTSKWTRGGKVEFEWWYPKNFDLLSIPKNQIPWWAKKKGQGTAVTHVPSPVSYKEAPPVVKGKLQEGYKADGINKWRDTENNLYELKDKKWLKNGEKWQPVEIKQGQLIPVYWAITKRALEEGRKMPTLGQKYKAEFLDILTSARKGLSGIERTKATSEYGFTTSSRIESKLKALEAELPGITEAGIVGPEIRTAKAALNKDNLMRRSVWDEYVDTQGRIQSLRPPVPHPTTGKHMRTRVEIVPITDKGELVLGHAYADNAPKDVFSFSGGGVHVTEKGNRLVRGGADIEMYQPAGISLTYGDSFRSAALQQLKEELGLIGKDTKYLGVSFGKGKDYGLTGFRVFETEVKGTPDPLRYHWYGVKRSDPKVLAKLGIKPEIDNWVVWNPKSDKTITVYPDDYYIIEGLAATRPDLGINMSKVKMYKGKGMDKILKAVDKDFAQRLRNNTMPTEAQIREVALKRQAALSTYFEKLGDKYAQAGIIPPTLIDLILEIARNEKGGIKIFKQAEDIIENVRRDPTMSDGEYTAVNRSISKLAKTIDEAKRKGVDVEKSTDVTKATGKLLNDLKAVYDRDRSTIPYKAQTIDRIKLPPVVPESRMRALSKQRQPIQMPSVGYSIVTPRQSIALPTTQRQLPTTQTQREDISVSTGRPTTTTRTQTTPRPSVKQTPRTGRIGTKAGERAGIITTGRRRPPIPERTPIPGTPPVPTPVERPFPFPFGGATSYEELTKEQKLASIAWRQGLFYHLIYPPYCEKCVLHSLKPFPGVKIYKGPKSAYKSITRVQGVELPKKVLWDLGIMDLTMETNKEGKIELKYVPDVKQQTHARKPIGYPEVKTVRKVRRSKRSTLPSVGNVR